MFAKIKCGLLDAAGSILNLYPSVQAASPKNSDIDLKMMGMDWYNVGNDLSKAMKLYESKQSSE